MLFLIVIIAILIIHFYIFTMQFFNILTKKIINTGTESKTLWFKAGTIKITKNGGSYLTLFHIPDVDFYIFEKKDEEIPEIQLEVTDEK